MEVTKAGFCVDLASKVGKLQKYAYSMVIYTVYIYNYILVGAWNMAFIFHIIWDVILPIHFHIFQDG